MRPSVFFNEWSERDQLVAAAVVHAEAMSCSGCGQNVVESFDPDREGWWQTERVTCTACQALADEQGKEQLGPGERIIVSPDPGYVRRT